MDQVLDLVSDNNLIVDRVLDTHPHADHVMASTQLKALTGAPNGIGEKVRVIATLWRDIYNTPDAFDPDADFDDLYAEDDSFALGDLTVWAMLSPGHTLESITYVCGDAASVHDTFMQPDSGTARADFPGGSADDLWQSLQEILELPDDTRLFVGHDYGAAGRDAPTWEATVADQKAHNIHVRDGTAKADYIKIREDHDATLALPDRMLASLQVNLRAGQLPAAEDDGGHYLKIPADKF